MTGSPYCQNAANPSPTFSGGGVAGTFSSTAGLVFVSTATGPGSIYCKYAGTYIVTNTIAASGGCAAVTATSSITITALPAATINYAGSPFCSSLVGAQSVTQSGTAGGTYSSTAGLTIDAATGAITPGTSTAGTYTVTYTMAAGSGCPAQSATTSVTITTLPAATISYAGTPFCISVVGVQAVDSDGYSWRNVFIDCRINDRCGYWCNYSEHEHGRNLYCYLYNGCCGWMCSADSDNIGDNNCFPDRNI